MSSLSASRTHVRTGQSVLPSFTAAGKDSSAGLLFAGSLMVLPLHFTEMERRSLLFFRWGEIFPVRCRERLARLRVEANPPTMARRCRLARRGHREGGCL